VGVDVRNDIYIYIYGKDFRHKILLVCPKVFAAASSSGPPSCQASSLPTAAGGWRGSWHCLSGEQLRCILFSWPESRKTALLVGSNPAAANYHAKITAWLVER
jgi:hypothetical protein